MATLSQTLSGGIVLGELDGSQHWLVRLIGHLECGLRVSRRQVKCFTNVVRLCHKSLVMGLCSVLPIASEPRELCDSQRWTGGGQQNATYA